MILMVNVISTMVVADIQALPSATIPITLPGSNSTLSLSSLIFSVSAPVETISFIQPAPPPSTPPSPPPLPPPSPAPAPPPSALAAAFSSWTGPALAAVAGVVLIGLAACAWCYCKPASKAQPKEAKAKGLAAEKPKPKPKLAAGKSKTKLTEETDRRRRLAELADQQDKDQQRGQRTKEREERQEAVKQVVYSWSDVWIDRKLGTGLLGGVFSAVWEGKSSQSETLTPGQSLVARVLHKEVVALHTHAELVDHALKLFEVCSPFAAHQNIVPFYGLATDRERWYAMLSPRLHCSLEQVLNFAESATPLRLTLSITSSWLGLVCGIADGLAHLHHHGLGHLTLRPSNVLLDESMSPKLADYGGTPQMLTFGLGQQREGVSGDQLGKEGPLYTPPERLRSDNDALSLAGDIWSLGCIIVRLFTQKPLYHREAKGLSLDEQADSFSQLLRIATGEWQPLSQLDAEFYVPPGLRDIVQRCTAVKTSERFTCDEVVADLERLLAQSRIAEKDDPLKAMVVPLADAYQAAADAKALEKGKGYKMPSPRALPDLRKREGNGCTALAPLPARTLSPRSRGRGRRLQSTSASPTRRASATADLMPIPSPLGSALASATRTRASSGIAPIRLSASASTTYSAAYSARSPSVIADGAKRTRIRRFQPPRQLPPPSSPTSPPATTRPELESPDFHTMSELFRADRSEASKERPVSAPLHSPVDGPTPEEDWWTPASMRLKMRRLFKDEAEDILHA